MCMSCGCKMPYDDMGSPDNITYDDIKKAVGTPDGKGLTVEQALKNIQDSTALIKADDLQYSADASASDDSAKADDNSDTE